jgi:hypothetical protein
MPHLLEPASSGRAKCRGCGRAIAKGEIRFGERLPNPFAEGEMTLWFHLVCAAYKRPEPFLETLTEITENIPERTSLEEKTKASLNHRRLPRIDGAERSPTAQAKCRSCHEPIEKETWRIRLVYFEEGMFSAGGFVHARCRTEYFETSDVADRVLHFSVNLSEEDLEALRAELGPSHNTR